MAKKILVIDNEVRSRNNIARFLREEGYEVDEADDGVSALEIDRHRDLDGVDDPLGIGQREVDRYLLPVWPAVRVCDRVAAGGQGLRAGVGSYSLPVIGESTTD